MATAHLPSTHNTAFAAYNNFFDEVNSFRFFIRVRLERAFDSRKIFRGLPEFVDGLLFTSPSL